MIIYSLIKLSWDMQGLFWCNAEFEIKFHSFVCDPKE